MMLVMPKPLGEHISECIVFGSHVVLESTCVFFVTDQKISIRKKFNMLSRVIHFYTIKFLFAYPEANPRPRARGFFR